MKKKKKMAMVVVMVVVIIIIIIITTTTTTAMMMTTPWTLWISTVHLIVFHFVHISHLYTMCNSPMFKFKFIDIPHHFSHSNTHMNLIPHSLCSTNNKYPSPFPYQ